MTLNFQQHLDFDLLAASPTACEKLGESLITMGQCFACYWLQKVRLKCFILAHAIGKSGNGLCMMETF